MRLNTSCFVHCNVQIPDLINEEDIVVLRKLSRTPEMTEFDKFDIDAHVLFGFIDSQDYFKASKELRTMLKELHIGHEDLYHNAHKFIFHH